MRQSVFETYSRWETKSEVRLQQLRDEIDGTAPASFTFTRMRRLGQSMLETIPGGRVLDVGSGTGHFVYYLKRLGFKAFGIEPEAKALEYAKKFAVLCHKGSVYDIVLTYDGITMIEVIEHLQWPEKALQVCCERAPNLWLTTPAAPERAALGPKNGMKLHCGFHLREWSPSCLKDFIEGCTDYRMQWQHVVDGHIEAHYAR